MSRRRLLWLVGLGLLGGSVGAASGALTEEELRWYRRLVYSGVDDEVIWSILGVKYGRVGNSLTPLWNTNTIGFSRIRYPEQGGYRVDTLEVVFYTDLASGERLESWYNPYTSREVEVIVPAPAAVSSYHSEVGPSERTAGGGIRIAESIQPPRTIGGDTWVQVEKRVAVAPDPAEALIFSSIEFVDYRGGPTIFARARPVLRPRCSLRSCRTGCRGWRWAGAQVAFTPARREPSSLLSTICRLPPVSCSSGTTRKSRRIRSGISGIRRGRRICSGRVCAGGRGCGRWSGPCGPRRPRATGPGRAFRRPARGAPRRA